jgi:3-phosphoshikimate 1-carboxyvinyltransferase
MSAVVVSPPGDVFRAAINLPGDKSLSHRALILAGMAGGESRVSNLGPGQDVAATAAVLAQLGVEVDDGVIRSLGVRAWRDPGGPLDCGNSGTTLRLLAGALAAQPFRVTLDGDASLRNRPMRRLIDPLAGLGADVETSPTGTPPITTGDRALAGAEIEIPNASAQVRSAVALAAIQAEGDSIVDSPPGFRDHTERWLGAFGLGERLSATRFRVTPGAVPPAQYVIPGDTSSAAYLWASAAIVPGARVETPGISLNPGRLGFLQVLETMGAHIEAEVTGAALDDPVGDVTVEGRSLQATEVDGPLAAATIDELPLVAVLGAYAVGITVVADAADLAAKESDRIGSTVEMIRALGGGAEPASDGFSVVGTGLLESGTVHAAGDHRIAMCAAVAASGATGPVRIEGAETAAVSWPGFFEEMERVWSSR